MKTLFIPMFIRTTIAMSGVFFLLSISPAFLLHSEEAGKISFPVDPLGFLIGETFSRPPATVALSDYFYAKPHLFLITYKTPFSLFILIDNSGSMKNGGSEGAVGQDPWGLRFEFYRKFLDALYQQFPKAEVGVAVFGSHLYFDPADNPLFKRMAPPHDTGGYLPLLTLDSVYAPIGKTGYTVIKELLETDTVINVAGARTQPYVDLKYTPGNKTLCADSSNIDQGFAAAKEAFIDAYYQRRKHIVIFSTDGHANYPPGDCSTHIAGNGMPQVFLRYTNPSDSTLKVMKTMIANITNNGYSRYSNSSQLFVVTPTNDSFFDTMVSKVLTKRFLYRDIIPTYCVINGISPTSVDREGFRFLRPFGFNPSMTKFSCLLTYKLEEEIDTIDGGKEKKNVLIDTVYQCDFFMTTDSGKPFVKQPIIEYWDRTIRFFNDGKPISLITAAMKAVEIRFIETKIQTLFNYPSVSIDLVTVAGQNQDYESFQLVHNGDFFRTGLTVSSQPPIIGDGIVQVQSMDSIIVCFHNKELPLDTLEATIAYNAESAIDPSEEPYVSKSHQQYTLTIFSALGRKIGEFSSDKDVSAALTAFCGKNLGFWNHRYRHQFAAGVYVARFTLRNPVTHAIVFEITKPIIR
ncbi:MAG: VWA domain-containing protein [Chitinivibrionales bacterium]|nr:VWA domain-containing protein [Chitinivibrionales bacterium]